QLARLVGDDARVGAHLQHRAVALSRAVEILRPAAADVQRGAAFRVPAHELAESGDEVVGHGQNLGMSGRGTAPPRTRIPLHSVQRRSVGTALPGLRMPAGSNAAFTAWKAAISAGRNCTHICASFSTPTPCSPVIVPPTATHASRMRAPISSPRSRSPGLLASKKMHGWMLPSPAWNTLPTRSPYSFASS